MPRKCIFNCKDVKHLHKFPEDEEEKKKWCKILGLHEPYVYPSNMLCDRHFDLKYLGWRNLKLGAVPTEGTGRTMEPDEFPQLTTNELIEHVSLQQKKNPIDIGELYVDEMEVAVEVEIETTSAMEPLSSHTSFNSDNQNIEQDVSPTLDIETEEISNSPDPNRITLESVKVTYKEPPKRTYSRTPIKRPRLVAPTYTTEKFCFCDCHKNKDTKKLLDVIEANRRKEERLKFQVDLHIKKANDLKMLFDQREKENANLRNMECNLTAEINKLTNKCLELTRRLIRQNENITTAASKFSEMICSNVHKYSDDQLDIAQSINYVSSKCYKFLKNDLKFNLPHPNTLLRLRPIRFIKPGIQDCIVGNLKKVTASFSKRECQCVIVHDEIEIRKTVEYNKSQDEIDGFEDLGKGRRSDKIAKRCLFFMIKGVCSDWKYILSFYCVGGSLKKRKLQKLLFENIAAATEVGLTVNAVVCDQGPSNVGLYNDLGITEEEPYFEYGPNKIFALYDYVHLFKSLRNNLMSKGFQTPEGSISGAYIRKMYDIDKNGNFRMCPKLTEAHINPLFFEKMNVARANQILSHSVAAGLDSCIKNGWIPKSADTTMKFVENCNNLFDELNCKSIVGRNKHNRPMFRGCEEKINTLENAINYFKTIEPQSHSVKCVQGLILTLRGIISLSKSIFKRCQDVQYFLIAKTNQDALENFFGLLRGCQGYNAHPSVKEVKIITARLTSQKLLNAASGSKGRNCEQDGETFLDWQDNIESDKLDRYEYDRIKEEIAHNISEIELYIENIETEKPSNVSVLTVNEIKELQVQRYILGFSIYKNIMEKSDCERCKDLMIKSNSSHKISEMFIDAKNFDPSKLYLVNPNDKVFHIFRLVMIYYKKVFLKFSWKECLKETIMNAILNRINCKSNWFLDERCKEHRLKHLDYLLRVLLYKNTKWLSDEMVADGKKRKRAIKLKKLNALY